MIRLVIISSVWKRPEVFEMFAKGIHELEKLDGIIITTIISGSEGSKSREMVEKHNFHYHEIPNEPLSEKVNITSYNAQFEYPDYILCLGSDDIIHQKLMLYYIELMKKGYDFIGTTDFYFYDTLSKKSLYWGGYREPYRKGFTAGAGRLISNKLLAKMNWKPWEIKDSLQLDGSMQDKLNFIKHSKFTFSLKEKGLFALDIKSSTNMTPFKLWDNTEYIDTKIIKKQFPYVFD